MLMLTGITSGKLDGKCWILLGGFQTKMFPACSSTTSQEKNMRTCLYNKFYHIVDNVACEKLLKKMKINFISSRFL